MKNALIIVREKKSALATLKKFDTYLKIQQKDYRLFWTTGYKGNMQEFKNESFWDTEEIPERIYTFSLRHGSDFISKEFFADIIAREKYVFGGSGYWYELQGKCNPGELPIIHPINESAPLRLEEIDELFKYAERTEERRSKILYYPEKEQELSEKYNSLLNPFECFFERNKSSLKNTGKKALVIWNDSIEQLPDEASSEYDLITSNEIYYIGDKLGFAEEIPVNFENYVAIIISAELNLKRKKEKEDEKWILTPLQVEAGLKVACDLRLLKLRQPIILCSFQSQDDLRSRDFIDFLAVPSGYFFDLESKEFSKPLPEKLQPISEYLLQDIIISHLTEGRLRQIIHDTGTSLLDKSEPERLQAIVEEGFEAMKQFFTEKYLAHTSEINAIKDEILKNILTEEDGWMRKNSFEATKEKLLRLLAPKDASESIEKPIGWNKVLYIEDNAMQREEVIANFREAEIDCITVGSGAEAIELLKKVEKEYRDLENDRKPHKKRLDEIEKILKEGKIMKGKDMVEITPEERKKIDQEKLQLQPIIDDFNAKIQEKLRSFPPVIVTDWRLLEDDGHNWQSMQGLDVILEIASNPQEYFRPVSFFMLTDKNESVLDIAKEQFPFQINWYTKRNILGRSQADFMEFANNVIKEGTRMLDSWIDLPSVRWNRGLKGFHLYPYKEYYAYYFMHFNYMMMKDSINSIAFDYVMRARLIHQNITTSRIPEEKRPIFRSKLLGELGDDLPRFLPKLIGRRIYFALSDHDLERGGIINDAVLSLIFYGCNFKDLESDESDNLSNLRTDVANHFFIKKEDYTKLPEENEWLDELKKKEEECQQRITSLFDDFRSSMVKIKENSTSAKIIAESSAYKNIFKKFDLELSDLLLKEADKITNLVEYAGARDLLKYLINEIANDRTTSGLLVNDYPELVEYCWNYEMRQRLKS